jgi:hypothetical protein
MVDQSMIKNNNKAIKNDGHHTCLNSSLPSINAMPEIGDDELTNTISVFSSTPTLVDSAYVRELKLRIRNHLTYSSLFLIFFCSPIVLIAIYYGLKARNQLKRGKNFASVDELLAKAHYINLMCFIIGSLIYATYFVVSILLISHSSLNS